MSAKRILLVEPGYRNKYPPLGLMKLASYHRDRGDTTRFVKGSNNSALLQGPWDRIYITTLFSFEWKRTGEAIDFAINVAHGQTERIFVGGIAASLMQDQFLAEPSWTGVRFIKGLLDGPPGKALQLSQDEGEFGADDLDSTPIDERVPDYSILSHVDYTYPVHDAYFGYASRGCVRKCAFCGVPKLEGAQRDMPPLSTLVRGVDAAHGSKKDLVLMDNNITASARYREVIAEIRDLGFTPGARFARPGKRPVLRRVDFNQGVDARILVKSPMYLREMATICISPLRIAFDHIGVRKLYERAVRMAHDNGIDLLSNYMLYNFMDSPEDLYRRMQLNIELNEELGIRIWSFPMRYQPVTLKDRSHVGRHWNRYILRSFQIMLQATRGVVSGNPSFFQEAFGEDVQNFRRLLTLPHAFIFHRMHYKSGQGRAIREEYESIRNKLSSSQEEQLMAYLHGPADNQRLPRSYYRGLAKDRTVDQLLRRTMHFHTLDTKDRLQDAAPPGIGRTENAFPMPSPEQRVEDAGLVSDREFSTG